MHFIQYSTKQFITLKNPTVPKEDLKEKIITTRPKGNKWNEHYSIREQKFADLPIEQGKRGNSYKSTNRSIKQLAGIFFSPIKAMRLLHYKQKQSYLVHKNNTLIMKLLNYHITNCSFP